MREKAIIAHFAGKVKPWNNTEIYFGDEWLKYAKMTGIRQCYVRRKGTAACQYNKSEITLAYLAFWTHYKVGCGVPHQFIQLWLNNIIN